MELSELYLNRHLYRDNNQDSGTKNSEFVSADSSESVPDGIPSGGAAQDINTGNVQIDGAQLEEGTYPMTVLDVANWGWGQTCIFSSTDLNTVSWGAGTFTSADGTDYAISAGNTGNMSAKTYIYLSLLDSETVYQTTTVPSDAVGIGKVLVGVAQNAAVAATYMLTEAIQIVSDNIIANTIDVSKLVAGQIIITGGAAGDVNAGATTITGGKITTNTIDANKLTFTAFDIGTDDLDDIGDGTSYGKVLSTQLTAGNITLISKTTSSRLISLDATVPHIKVAYNNTDVIQMAVVGTEPKLEVYFGGNIRTRLTKNALYFYGTDGSWIGDIFGQHVSGPGLYIETDDGAGISNPLYLIAPQVIIDGDTISLNFGTAQNSIIADGTHLQFDGDTNSHLVPVNALIDSAQLGTTSNYWGKCYVNTYYGKNTTVQSFDHYDDLQILRELNTSKVNVDVSSLPSEIISNEGFVDMNSLAGFSLCASKMIVKCIDDLKDRIDFLEEELMNK